jgi:hypothetical protein
MRRVAEHAGVDRPTAERGVAAVLSALHETVGHKEFTEAMAQLPKEFDSWWRPRRRRAERAVRACRPMVVPDLLGLASAAR